MVRNGQKIAHENAKIPKNFGKKIFNFDHHYLIIEVILFNQFDFCGQQGCYLIGLRGKNTGITIKN